MNSDASPQPSGPRSATSVGEHVKRRDRLALGRRFKKPPEISTRRWICLLVALGADGLLALALAVAELSIDTGISGLLGAGILSAIGIGNLWALNSVARDIRDERDIPKWARDAIIAQIGVLSLAIYVFVVVGYRSPRINWTLLVITAVIGLLAILWILVLWGQAALHWGKKVAVITALVPLAGGVQFWLQNYYIPETSVPQVDISAELTPQGKTQVPNGSTIHLSAKVTVHNRGSVRVNVAGAIMRVTAYAAKPGPEELPLACLYDDEKWCRTEGGVDISGRNYDSDWREKPTPAIESKLLYAGLFVADPDSFLAPGETDTTQREVDIDHPEEVGLVRLSVSSLFLTERKIKDIKSCWQAKERTTMMSMFTNSQAFAEDVESAQDYSDENNIPGIDPRAHQHYLCMDYYYAPRNVIDVLEGNTVVQRVRMILNDPQQPNLEYPQADFSLYLANRSGQVEQDLEFSRKTVEEAYPTGSFSDVTAEYAPADQIPGQGKS